MKQRDIVRKILDDMRGAQDASTYLGKGYIDITPYVDQVIEVIEVSKGNCPHYSIDNYECHKCEYAKQQA